MQALRKVAGKQRCTRPVSATLKEILVQRKRKSYETLEECNDKDTNKGIMGTLKDHLKSFRKWSRSQKNPKYLLSREVERGEGMFDKVLDYKIKAKNFLENE